MYKADENTIEMANFPIEGNISDHSWPFIIIKENGKPDHLAIVLLAHVVYWYRPSFDAITKQLGKKYKADLLQRSYSEIEDMLGLTKREAQEAFQRLEKLDIVHRVLRTIEINGQKISNILFIKFNHSKLTAMRDAFFKKCIPLYAEKDEGVRQKGQAHTPIVMTYTENTTQNSPEISTTAATTHARSAAAVGKKDNFSSEDIKYSTPSGKEKSITSSEIYSHFLKFKYKTETITEAIQTVKQKQEPISNILKLLESICLSIENNPKNIVKSNEPKKNSWESKPKSTEKGGPPPKEWLDKLGIKPRESK